MVEEQEQVDLRNQLIYWQMPSAPA